MTLQRLIDSLFGKRYEPHVFGYLDDIIVASATYEQHLYWVEFVLRRLVAARLSVNKDKCEFGKARLTYLGFVLDKEGLRPDPEKVAPMRDLPRPRCISELRSFLGRINWYARFIKSESLLKIPLIRLLCNGAQWEWGEGQEEAFVNLKHTLREAPVLVRPDFSRMFFMQTDSSEHAIAAVLTQRGGDDKEHPVAYLGRVLTSAEKNYPIIERKCLAVLWALDKL